MKFNMHSEDYTEMTIYGNGCHIWPAFSGSLDPAPFIFSPEYDEITNFFLIFNIPKLVSFVKRKIDILTQNSGCNGWIQGLAPNRV